VNRAQAKAADSAPAPSDSSAAWYAVIFCVTLLAYWPAARGALLWDDNAHLTRLEMQSLRGLWRIWFEPGATQQYYPLLHSAFWVEHRIWGDATIGYHLLNIALHCLAACLLVAIVRRLALRGACFVGLIFALHPVCVESVAWISEQKNTLAAVFYLGAALASLQFDSGRSRSRRLCANSLPAGAIEQNRYGDSARDTGRYTLVAARPVGRETGSAAADTVVSDRRDGGLLHDMGGTKLDWRVGRGIRADCMAAGRPVGAGSLLLRR
jgi:hypothetical protein